MELRPGFDVAFEKLVEVAAAAAARSANSNADQNIPEEIKWRDAEIARLRAENVRLQEELDLAIAGRQSAIIPTASPTSSPPTAALPVAPTNVDEALEGLDKIEELIDRADESSSLAGTALICAKVVLTVLEGIPCFGAAAKPFVQALG